MTKNFIITTTINQPTEAIIKYDNLVDWNLIVVDDKKTPRDYNLQRGFYFSPEEQEHYDKELSDLIEWNCIQRRNFGLLKAHDLGAEIIATIDDDNIPYANWGEEILINKNINSNYYVSDEIAFDPISITNHKNIWHRGFPIQLLNSRNYKLETKIIKPMVQADFWNGDPDIDAICRMEHRPDCKFDEKYFPFSSNTFSPFNSQNTFLHKSVIKDYFLFPHIGRMDDIWASYYLESLGNSVIYNKPTVYQERNEHNLTIDFEKEIIGYINNIPLLEDLKKSSKKISNYLPEKSNQAFKRYKSHF